MHRAITRGTLLAALVVGAGCQNQAEAPTESAFIPRPNYVSVQAAGPSIQTTRVTGYAWDPEAWLMSFLDCTQKCVPPLPALPPILIGNNPLFIRSSVGQTQVSMVDLDASLDSNGKPQTVAATAAPGSSPLGIWTIDAVPSRPTRPYYPAALEGGGALLPQEALPPPFRVLSPIPPATYQKTVSLQPVLTEWVDCMAVNVPMASDKGILEAVAKYLTVKGTATTVADLTNPSRFAGVTILWNFSPGLPSLRLPAFGTTVEPSAGQPLNINWAPPGLVPPAIQSTRGFFVDDSIPVSAMGIVVVLVPAGPTAPSMVTYSVKDPSTDAATGHPYQYRQIRARPLPGVISFAATQLDFVTGPQWSIVEKSVCASAEQ